MALRTDCESRGPCVRLAREMAPERLRFYSYDMKGRRNSSSWDRLGDPSLCDAVALSRTVQCGLAERHMGLTNTTDENLACETEKIFAVQICWGCFVAEVHSG